MALALLLIARRQQDVDVSIATVIKRSSFVVFLISLLGPASIFAAAQSLQQVQSAAEKFVHGELPSGGTRHFVTAGALDARVCRGPRGNHT